jgi:hypothetical protein
MFVAKKILLYIVKENNNHQFQLTVRRNINIPLDVIFHIFLLL